MAAEDRDHIFEKALEQHLRATRTDRGAEASGWQSADGCLDAETLAAYHERRLSAEQTVAAKQHILACEHCQALLEQLRATDEIPLSVTTFTAPEQTAGGSVAMLKPRRIQIWRWVAPAGAIAAAVLVWVGVRENPRVHKLPANEMAQTAAPAPAAPQMQAVPEAIAKAKPPSAAPLAAQMAPSAPRSDADKSLRRDSRAAYSGGTSTFLPKDEAGHTPRPADGLAITRQENVQRNLKSEEAELSHDIAAAEKKQKFDAATDGLNQVVSAEPRREQGAAIGGALNQSEKVESAGAAKASQRKAAAAAQPAASPAPTAPAPSGAQQQEMQGMSRFKEAPAVLLANSPANVAIAAPGGAVRWRVGPSGSIAHSSDGGKTWMPQASSVSVGLAAGAAVSEQICWVVGDSGTVLLTTDGGAHWQKLSAPTGDDLLSISAIDARQAKVSAAISSYQTTDGGATWHKLAPE